MLTKEVVVKEYHSVFESYADLIKEITTVVIMSADVGLGSVDSATLLSIARTHADNMDKLIKSITDKLKD